MPIYWRPSGSANEVFREVYYAEVAGGVLERGNLDSLTASLEETVLGLLKFGTIPSYFLIITDGQEEGVPVYAVNGGLQARLHGGPQFNGRDIGHLASFVRDYLSLIKNGRTLLTAATLSWQDLRLYKPLFVLIAQSSERIWIPVFREGGRKGRVVAQYDGQIFPQGSGDGTVIELWHQVSSFLYDKKELKNPYDLYIGDVLPELWQAIKGYLKPTGFALHTTHEVGERDVPLHVPIYQNGSSAVLAYVPLAGGAVHLGPDPEELRTRVGWDLEGKGVIPRADIVTLGSAIIYSS